MKFAYADPPYLGQCQRYGHDHGDPYNVAFGCWNDLHTHSTLVRQLVDDFPDGWAMSLSSSSLQSILPMCPEEARVAAWVKPFCAFKKGVRPCYAWEPVIFIGGRNPSNGTPHPPPEKGGMQTTPKDYLSEPIIMKTGLTGAKPERFCRWVADLLGYLDDDELVDYFPGTGIMGRTLAQARLL